MPTRTRLEREGPGDSLTWKRLVEDTRESSETPRARRVAAYTTPPLCYNVSGGLDVDHKHPRPVPAQLSSHDREDKGPHVHSAFVPRAAMFLYIDVT